MNISQKFRDIITKDLSISKKACKTYDTYEKAEKAANVMSSRAQNCYDVEFDFDFIIINVSIEGELDFRYTPIFNLGGIQNSLPGFLGYIPSKGYYTF